MFWRQVVLVSVSKLRYVSLVLLFEVECLITQIFSSSNISVASTSDFEHVLVLRMIAGQTKLQYTVQTRREHFKVYSL